MDPYPRFDELVAPLRDNVVSGASVLGRSAADVLRSAAIRLQAGSLEELHSGLGELSRRVLEAQPAMAPLVLLVRDVMAAVEAADSLESGRHAAASAADTFRNTLSGRGEAVAEAALELLPVGGIVGTISSSSTVRAALVGEAGPRGISVLCFESRPMNEGRTFAESLAEAGVDIIYAVDAAARTLVPTCDAILVGADSIGDLGIVNKIGSAMIAQAATAAGVPVYVLADETKILPRGLSQLLDDDRPAAEVWDAPPGVRVWNRYFEVVPMEYVTAVVTEKGVLSPAELEEMRGALE
jgi:translation initiation factor 2B subunit (eIF-2B alpha/beta/delta family)